MAIKPTPNNNIFKSLIFDGVNSRDYGIYITGDAVFNSPERDVEMIEIPGRNGAYALDKGRFSNIEVSYPAGIAGDTEADFRQGISAFRNALASRKGYKRLEDEYNPDEYRMAVYKSGLEVTPKALKSGEFTITFDCQPQRFLKSGEIPRTIGGQVTNTQTESGSVVSIESDGGDAVTSLVAQIEPKQDLHGYDYPFPAGGGPNVFTTVGATFDIVYGSDGTETSGVYSGYSFAHTAFIPVKPNTKYTISGTNRASTQTNHRVIGWTSGKVYVGQEGNLILNPTTLTENSIEFTTSATTAFITVNYVYKANGVLVDEQIKLQPYENICPITGWTGANVFVTGVNVWDEEWESGDINIVDGSKRAAGDRIRSKNFIPVSPNGTYYSMCNYQNPVICFYDEAKRWVSGKLGVGYVVGKNVAFTVPSWCYYVMFYYNGTTYNHDISINYPSTDTAYHPYTGTTYPVSFGSAGTVYGGTGDVVTGVLTVTHKAKTFDGSENWLEYEYNGNKSFRLYVTDMQTGNNLPLLSNRLTFREFAWSATSGYYIGDSNKYIYVRNQDITTVNDFKSWLASNPLQVVYPLATPTTVQLTAQEVELLTGNNNVWADTGDITLTYGADPNKIVNPTLFDASPLLKVYGYGDIVLGDGGAVSVSEDVTVGNTVLANGGQVGLTYTESIVMGSDKFMTGDVITLASTSININLNTNESITSAAASVSSGYSVNTSVTKINNRTLLATVLWDEETLTVGTSRDMSTIVNVSIVTSGGNVVVQIPATISYNASTRTITRTLQTPTAISGTVSRIGGYSILGSITGYSTAPAYTEPLYFDLSIGEAYAIEDGVPVSINGAVSFGVDLPVLPPGASTITYDNTIDSLEIIPRWWEV